MSFCQVLYPARACIIKISDMKRCSIRVEQYFLFLMKGNKYLYVIILTDYTHEVLVRRLYRGCHPGSFRNWFEAPFSVPKVTASIPGSRGVDDQILYCVIVVK